LLLQQLYNAASKKERRKKGRSTGPEKKAEGKKSVDEALSVSHQKEKKLLF